MGKQERSIITDSFQSKQKNPGRSKALLERWRSQDPRWQEWRENFRKKCRERKMTPETRARLSQIRVGKADLYGTEEFRNKISKTRGGIRGEVIGLLQRGWTAPDVIRLGFERRQVTNLFERVRRSNPDKRPSVEEGRQILRRAHRRLATNDINHDLLARKFLDSGMLPEIAYWGKLQQLYKNQDRSLPPEPAIKLRLEVLLFVREEILKGNMEPLRLYENLGDEVDPAWFDSSLEEEEEFIITAMGDHLGYREDKGGFFRVVDGQRFRPVDLNDGNVVVFGSGDLAKRKQIRDFRAIPDAAK